MLMETRVKEYFESLPSKLIRTAHIESVFQRLRAFPPVEGQAGFKPTELMNIANLRPTSLVSRLASPASTILYYC
jgi:hypothetical protein